MMYNLPMLADILTDQKLRHQEFPVTEHKVFLAHAAVCPLPGCVARAVSDYVWDSAQKGQFEHLYSEAEFQTRQLAAKLIRADPTEIAFIASTSHGLSLVAAGVDWKTDDNVVIAQQDFPANIYPWLGLERKGVEVRFIPPTENGSIIIDDLSPLIDEKTRLVSLSSLHYLTGTPIDLDGIGSFLRKQGILFCVDAIQSLGAIPCSVENVDFLTADAHKWLLGPQGIGILYVKQENFDRLYPALLGWKSVSDQRNYTNFKLNFPESASRYEPGSLNAPGLIGLHSALKLIDHIGVANIAQRLTTLRNILIKKLNRQGYDVLGVPDEKLATGITTFKSDKAVELHKHLNRMNFVVSLRNDPAGNKCIRVSPHFYNTEEEIDALSREL
ncbi:MAG: aminotransferase class V-fold PLP-dependent enzyme [Sedimentisphaerales bacterium]|nr:aminotransferase class V-fold PLP-dependent enzyme [Sedimentisphaerales bacterium]